MTKSEITVNSLVEFIHPNPDEIGLVMKVLEVNDNRLLVESLVGMAINPTSIVLISDVKILDSGDYPSDLYLNRRANFIESIKKHNKSI